MSTSFDDDTSELAHTYDRLSDSQLESGKRLVERMGLAEGNRVLDVGCGTGRLARWMAERVGASGAVVGIDPLPERVALARAHGGGLRFEVGHAEDLSAFEPDSFDAVCMSAVFHWIADRARALRESRRVLRPGGRLGVTTIPHELRMAGTVARTMAPVLGAPRYVDHVDLSALAIASGGQTTTDLMTMLLDCELELVELHVVARTRVHPDGEHVLDFFESSSFGNFLRIVPAGLRPALRADLVAAFDARKGPEGIVLRDWGTLFVAARPA